MGKDDKEEIPINQAGGLCTEWKSAEDTRKKKQLAAECSKMPKKGKTQKERKNLRD